MTHLLSFEHWVARISRTVQEQAVDEGSQKKRTEDSHGSPKKSESREMLLWGERKWAKSLEIPPNQGSPWLGSWAIRYYVSNRNANTGNGLPLSSQAEVNAEYFCGKKNESPKPKRAASVMGRERISLACVQVNTDKDSTLDQTHHQPSVLKSITQWPWAARCRQSPSRSALLLRASLSDAWQSFWDAASLSSQEFPFSLSFLHVTVLVPSSYTLRMRI